MLKHDWEWFTVVTVTILVCDLPFWMSNGRSNYWVVWLADAMSRGFSAKGAKCKQCINVYNSISPASFHLHHQLITPAIDQLATGQKQHVSTSTATAIFGNKDACGCLKCVAVDALPWRGLAKVWPAEVGAEAEAAGRLTRLLCTHRWHLQKCCYPEIWRNSGGNPSMVTPLWTICVSKRIAANKNGTWAAHVKKSTWECTPQDLHRTNGFPCWIIFSMLETSAGISLAVGTTTHSCYHQVTSWQTN